ncbi:MAG TPA: hypothetical protein IAA54_06665 [Candidatus Gallacutalibacter pullicola]|uniref:Uncharacterized protein n=1 Tax=Candidatus Gallacutalibacter pullicola TaxID=2840830 RepID=A0A9D1DQS9_9FIRM|nr:hypothetical protein [Candidatus Gallacutalibacter pullicola]
MRGIQHPDEPPAAMGTPVSVVETAGESDSWGIALPAAYLVRREDGESAGLRQFPMV